MNKDVLIVGAGLAGLCCARQLQKEGVSFQILEAADDVGGRVRTDEVDGYRLDRGFQTLLTAYPEAEAQLDYEALSLRAFPPAALVRAGGQLHRIVDPWREGGMLGMLFSHVGTFGDKFRMSKLRGDVTSASVEELFARREQSTRRALDERRFSPKIVEELFRPTMGAFQLDPQLTGSSRMFEFVMSMLFVGDVAIPELGMGEIPKQLARSLPGDSVRLNAQVASVSPSGVKLASGEELSANAVVVATEGLAASRLLRQVRSIPVRNACCIYYAADEAPIDEAIVILNGGARGFLNHVSVVSNLTPSCAPAGKHLISVTVRGFPTRDDQSMSANVLAQLGRWFGKPVEDWRVLRTYRIERAMPIQVPLGLRSNPKVAPGLYVCGDHQASPSIQGAMESGRLAAEAVAAELRGEVNPHARISFPVAEAS